MSIGKITKDLNYSVEFTPTGCYFQDCLVKMIGFGKLKDVFYVNHILLHYTVVMALWEIVLALFGANWVFLEKVKEMLVSWRGLLWGERGKGYGLPFRCVFFGRSGRIEID